MCKLCETEPVYVFTNQRKLCKNCFGKWFEKKFLYIIKKFSLIKKGDKIFYKKGKDFRSVVLDYLLKRYEERAPIEIVNKNYNKVVKTLNVDQISSQIIGELLKGDLSKLNIKPKEKNLIYPLYLFLDKEILLYAKIKNLKYNKIKEKKSFLESIEEKHPEVKRAVVNSYLKLRA